jgi:hypothetical protein
MKGINSKVFMKCHALKGTTRLQTTNNRAKVYEEDDYKEAGEDNYSYKLTF